VLIPTSHTTGFSASCPSSGVGERVIHSARIMSLCLERLPADPDGIIAFYHEISDDGKWGAHFEIVARNRAALLPILPR